ncbi:hypothetical protein ZTR_03625 [Talaromyces verruculosus]|nr:hypothetical protein ZTR_03625 [Talaromyces verruculosus]
MGVRWVLSPELDVARELRNGRVGEMYWEDQSLNGVFGTSYVKTMQEKDENGYMRIATTIKHFVYGSSTGGINTASQNGGLNHLFNDLIQLFITVIKDSQPASVMISYASIDREPMSANRFMMRTILREKLGFDGVLMSDAEAILHLYTQSKVAKSLEDAALRALKARLQLELSPAQPAAFPTLLSSINSTLVRERIDDAVLKILVIKFQTGLLNEEANWGMRQSLAVSVITQRPTPMNSIRRVMQIVFNSNSVRHNRRTIQVLPLIRVLERQSSEKLPERLPFSRTSTHSYGGNYNPFRKI